MRAIADFDFFAAAQLNPLIALAAVLIVGWAFLRIFDRVSGAGTEKRLVRQLKRLRVVAIALGLIVLNWLYLVFFLK